MRKLMLMASMLAMVLLAASPAVAQDGGDAADDSVGGAGGTQYNVDVNTEICQNIIGDINVAQENNAAQYAGDDTAVNNADGDGNVQAISQDDVQNIAQANNTTINIVQQCATGAGVNIIGPAGDDFNGDGVVDGGDDLNGDGFVGAEDDDAAAVAGDDDAAAVAGDDDAAAAAGAAGAAAGADDAEAGAVAVLPDTGGASLFTLAAGALLVAGGLLARRIVR